MRPTDSSKRYFLGVDVGNTKTHALIAALNGEVRGFAEIGCGSYEVLGPQGYADALRQVTDLALKNSGISQAEIAGMGFGIAGYDWPSEREIIAWGIDVLGMDAPYEFVNDVEIGLIAGSKSGWGIAVDAGTGNNVRGRNENGRIGRITGNSVHFGEFGGGSELIWRAVSVVSYAWTQRGPQTALTEAFLQVTGLNSVEELLEELAARRLQPSPELAKAVFQVAAEGDPVAQDVIRWNAQELAESTKAVIRQLDLQDKNFEVVLIGSLFKTGEIYISPFRERLQAFAPGAELVYLSVPPVVGAVLLGAEAAGVNAGAIREKLIQSTEERVTSLRSSSSV